MIYRLRDILIVLVLLLLLSPLMLGLAILLKIRYGHIIFKQKRIGKNDKPFHILKFSKMEEEKMDVHFSQEEIHSFGLWMQKYSLDELPQLLNVLSGEMSLVGPRPLLPEYLDLYTAEERRRHLVKPGITGWAQIQGRAKISFKKRFELDLWYIAHRSFWLDIKILYLTFIKVLRASDTNFSTERFDGEN